MAMPTFKKREEIPSGFESEYEEKDGEWVPKELTELKNAHERSKEAARLAKEALAEKERELADLRKQSKQKASGKTDAEIEEERKAIEAEKKPLQDALTAAQQELRSLRLDGTVKQMLLKAGADPDALEDLYTVIAPRFDLSESGTPILKDRPTADLKKYIAETLPAEKSRFFLSKQKAGVEFPGGDGKGATEETTKLLTTNPAQLLQLANQKQ